MQQVSFYLDSPVAGCVTYHFSSKLLQEDLAECGAQMEELESDPAHMHELKQISSDYQMLRRSLEVKCPFCHYCTSVACPTAQDKDVKHISRSQ